MQIMIKKLRRLSDIICSQCLLFYTHLTDCECSLRINCEFCQMDTKLWNISKDKNQLLINELSTYII